MRAGRLPRKRVHVTSGGAIEYVRSGTGSPTLLLFNGAGVTLEGWQRLYPGIEALGTVLAWNRFGVGGSDKPGVSQSGAAVVGSLRALLSALELAPPYLVVGHSLGGLYANLFARLHPQDVCGVVLLEPTHPRDREQLKGHHGQLAGVLGKLLSMPARLLRPNLESEIDWVDATAQEVDIAGPFPPVPLAVVTGGSAPPRWLVPEEALRIRRTHQQELSRLSPLGQQVIAQRSGHFPQITQPELVLDVIRRTVAAARGEPTAVPGPDHAELRSA